MLILIIVFSFCLILAPLYELSASVTIIRRPPISKYPKRKTSIKAKHPLMPQHIEHDAAEITEILKGHKSDTVSFFFAFQ